MGQWRIQFFGKFEVWTPSGVLLQAHRKEKALLALLVWVGEAGMGKAELEAALWPNSNPKLQRSSLRNALCAIRKAVGHGNVETAGSHCRISPEFRVSTDCQSSNPTSFMPEFDGEWFEDIRLQFIADEPHLSSKANVSNAFLTVLTWYAETDSAKLYESMRCSGDLVLGLPSDALSKLIGTADRRGPVPSQFVGWRHYWRACHAQASDLECSDRHLRQALDIGVSTKDILLAAQAINWLGATRCLTNRFRSALKLADLGSSMANTSKDPQLCARLEFSRANVYLHTGDSKGALEVFARVENLMETGTTEFAYQMGLSALYEACAGKTREAEMKLAVPTEVAEQTGSGALLGFCGLTKGYLFLNAEEWQTARNEFTKTLKVLEDLGGSQCQVYAHEGLAIANSRLLEVQATHRHLSQAQNLRSQLGMKFTAWDRSRFRKLINALCPKQWALLPGKH